jgi:hypothetical protein
MNERGNSGCLIAVIVFLVLIILAGAVVFFFLFRNRTDMPDINEFISEVENSKQTTDGNNSIADMIKIQLEGGTSKISFQLTNADLTLLANDTMENNEEIPLDDIMLNCNEDHTIDITAVLSDFTIISDNPDIPGIAKSLIGSLENKRIYATIYIDYAGNNEFDIEIVDIKIGKLNIPFLALIFDPMSENISNMLEEQLDAAGNFELQDFSVEENYLEFSGIVTN